MRSISTLHGVEAPDVRACRNLRRSSRKTQNFPLDLPRQLTVPRTFELGMRMGIAMIPVMFIMGMSDFADVNR